MIMISAVALSVLGTTLYQVKTGIDERQSRLRVLEAELKMTKRDIAILEAEWAYLSRPERVTELSGRLLQMEPIGQDRILPLDAIPMRLMPEFDSADGANGANGGGVIQFAEDGSVILPADTRQKNDQKNGKKNGLMRTVAADQDAGLSAIIIPVPNPARSAGAAFIARSKEP